MARAFSMSLFTMVTCPIFLNGRVSRLDTPPTEEVIAPTEEVIAPTEEIVIPTEEVNKELITE